MSGRVPRAIWIGLILCGALFASAKLIPTFLHSTIDTLADRDFSNLWMAGRLAINGSVETIFNVDAFQAASRESLHLHFPNNYSYPPHALFVAMPFGALAYPTALLLWNGASLGLFYLAAKPHVSTRLPAWVVLLSPASLICMVYGHYGLLCGALWLWAFRQKWWAAAFLTIKPHLGLLVLVQMSRNRATLISAVAATLALIGLSVAAFGVEPWRAFFTTTLNLQLSFIEGDYPGIRTNMVTPIIGYGALGQIAFAAAATLLLTRAFNVFTAATATFLIIPYAFHYDLTVVCLGFAVLLACNWTELRTWQKITASLAFLAPGLVAVGAWAIPPILLAGLYVQVIFSRNSETPCQPETRCL